MASSDIRVGLWNRYSAAYRVSDGIVSLGKLVKIISVLIGLVFIISPFILRNEVPSLLATEQMGTASIIIGVSAIGSGWVWGLLVEAFGQMIRATIDIAVNTSPLMDTGSKAQFLGL